MKTTHYYKRVIRTCSRWLMGLLAVVWWSRRVWQADTIDQLWQLYRKSPQANSAVRRQILDKIIRLADVGHRGV